MNLNKVFIFGNVTRDPELRQTPGGQSVCTLGVATNSFYNDKSGQRQQRAEFHNVVIWGKQAEVAGQYLKKGSSVLIEGRLQTRSWQDQQGQTRKTTEIICERMQLGPRGGSSRQGGFDRGNFSDNDDQTMHMKEELPEINIEEEIKAEDIPF
jgi:single-strand DNA-binding protein